MKRLAILGSTGSIGRQTLEVVRAFPQEFSVVALAAGKNVDLLARQVAEFRPLLAYSPRWRRDTCAAGTVRFATMDEIVEHPDVDLVMIATSGKAGLGPCLAAIRAGKNVALSNKEALVMAGGLVMQEAHRCGVTVLPVDSEHSALWQCLRGEEKAFSRLVLTASGGPFRQLPLEQLASVTVERTLQHPTWAMGPKVTVDSATLMNKGLEIIEAHWLFQAPYDRIEVVVHPESIVHSLVEFADGSTKAQLSYPDMRLPIQYALSYPDRFPARFVGPLDLARASRLTFERPDPVRFPCLRLAREAGVKGGTYPAALCAADEVAVSLFLEKRIGFMDIPGLIQLALDKHVPVARPSLAQVMEADERSREVTMGLAGASL